MKTIRSITQLFTQNISALVTVCLIGLGACAATGGSTPTDSEAALMQNFTNYKAAWNRHDVSALTGYFQQNGTLYSPDVNTVSGPALTGYLQGLFTAIPDFKVELKTANFIGNQSIADQWVIKGTWTQPFPGGPLAGAKPTGKSFAVPGSGFYEWKDGKIVSGTHYFDQLSFLTQIGVIAQK